jgi:hypothetical protein
MEHEEPIDNVISPEYQPAAKLCRIEPPAIPTGYVYMFTSHTGLRYEVRFANKADNFFGMVVNFSVLSEDYENEYSVTNRGEIYSIIATVIEIIRMFHNQHYLTDSYEFCGEFKDDESHDAASIRTRLYVRYAKKALNKGWKIELHGNKVFLKK